VRAYLACPEGDGPWPGIVMVHENPGLTPHREDVTRRLATEGYVALTPNLYSRIGGAPPPTETAEERRRLVRAAAPNEQVMADLENGRAVLAARREVFGDRIGLFGHCMGGSKAFYTACHSQNFRCLVDFYGAVVEGQSPDSAGFSFLPFARDLSCPMQYHVGEEDNVCPMDQVEQLRAELDRHHKSAVFFTYPGASHAFHDDSAPRRYRPEAAALAWRRAMGFFAEHLGR